MRMEWQCAKPQCVLEAIRAKHAENEIAPIALLVWSEALRNPALASQLESAAAQMRADLANVVRVPPHG